LPKPSRHRLAGDFETQRGLSGWREAVLRHLDAKQGPDAVQVPLQVSFADAEPIGSGTGACRQWKFLRSRQEQRSSEPLA
jgi:hypothetical protein